MRTVILYSAPASMALADLGYQPVIIDTGPMSGLMVYVRAESVDAEDLVDALDKAEPRVGETVLNTVAL